jgi:hypothetical protein
MYILPFSKVKCADTPKLNANANPIAMQVMAQTVLCPKLMSYLWLEISPAKTRSSSFDMHKIASAPKLKSIF